jgi:hypothetical protein
MRLDKACGKLAMGLLLVALGASPSLGQGDPARVGRWDSPRPWPIVGIHAAVLPTGDVMHLTYMEVETEVETAATTWNPETNRFQDVSPGFGDMFCSGQAFLPSGELLVAGGYAGLEVDRCGGMGVRPAYIFEPFSATWRDLGDMSSPRFYPTVVSLANGKQLIIAGQGENCQYIPYMEIFTPPDTLSRVRGPNRIMRDYPRAFLLSDGSVVQVGIEPTTSILDRKMKFWTSIALTQLGRTRYEPAAFYVPGHTDRIMICGGYLVQNPNGTRDTPTNTCEIIDALAERPTWRSAAPLRVPRGDINAVLLPDGKVLLVGGGELHRYQIPDLAPELYDPVTNTWTTMASQTWGRMYHSTAVLLPDGRVLSAGQDGASHDSEVSGRWGEIFSPPYLFRGKRPILRKAPSEADYGSAIKLTVKKVKASKIRNIVLMGLSTVTHSHDSGQRYVPLDFSVTGRRTLEATVTSNPNIAPPGYYMLFVLNAKGVPSVARMIRLS